MITERFYVSGSPFQKSRLSSKREINRLKGLLAQPGLSGLERCNLEIEIRQVTGRYINNHKKLERTT
jgi:hypothetical protein